MHSLVLGVESQTSTTYADFFDSSFTFFNESIQVRCCSPGLTLTNVTCGQGTSCIGQCSAIGASLCLSEVCTADPDDCNISLEPEKRKKRRAGTCKACQSLQALRKCAPKCRVRKQPACCFHPVCYGKRPKYCSSTNYFSGIPFYLDSKKNNTPGNSCPKPGSIPNGKWSCQTQELALPDTTFLDGSANTYPSKKDKPFQMYIFSCYQLYSAG